MFSAITTILAFTALTHASAIPSRRDGTSGTESMTPHDSYSSSIGVLGCKINTDRVAYWPSAPDCNKICLKITGNNGKTLNLLHIDQSGGAYDISYDAWSELNCGVPATDGTCQGGGVSMQYEYVDNSECSSLLTGASGKLAFSAANSMDFISSCAAGSWVADNHALYNIANPTCTYGYDEVCTLASGANQATCAHQLGSQEALTSAPVYNIEYPSGQKVLAT
ncbi:hypothetical protein BD289DRAFT_464279 [Coniella lustricola]|uniref:Cerato-platanin n=1 Tax=Coniella lustricola TaxID=2025994 RepID=A0A2T3ANQ0_9PEZI|nr:hypothetical protein BD289DRAFT_464279 [Coniella lustricola]